MIGKHMGSVIVVCLLIGLSSSPFLVAQTPPPPPPEDNDAGKIRGNIDLSKVPIPEEDKKEEQNLTDEERRAPQISITIMPVGFVPPPIIYLDKSGMPREKYRHPLEYAPAVYHIKSQRGTIRMMGAQNNLGVGHLIPKMRELVIYRENPPEPEAAVDDTRKGPRLTKVGTVVIPADLTHALIVLTKDPEAKHWRKINMRLIDMSPAKRKNNQVRVVNMARTPLGIGQGKDYATFRPGTISTHSLVPSDNGVFYYILAASMGQRWKQIAKTGVRLRDKEQLLFVAWPMPRSKVIPTGAAVTTFRYLPKKIPKKKVTQ